MAHNLHGMTVKAYMFDFFWVPFISHVGTASHSLSMHLSNLATIS